MKEPRCKDHNRSMIGGASCWTGECRLCATEISNGIGVAKLYCPSCARGLGECVYCGKPAEPKTLNTRP